MDDKFFIPDPVTSYEHRTVNAQDVPRLTEHRPFTFIPRAPKVTAARMTFLAMTTALILVSIGAGIAFLASQREAQRNSAPSTACKNETILLEIEEAAGPIVSVEQQGADVLVKVDWRSWNRATRQRQIDIGMAAYCHAALAAKGGVAHIVSNKGEEYARVAAGKWSSKLFAE